MRDARRRTEHGAAVVLVLGLVALLVTVACVAGGVVALLATHRKAQAAADLAALAGAHDLRAGRDPCRGVVSIAGANGAEVRECQVEGEEIRVQVFVRTSALLGSRELDARARAGPTSADVAEHPGDLDP